MVLQTHTSNRKAEGSRSRRKRSMLSHICALCDKFCHIKHKVAADVKHIMAPQKQYAKRARCASVKSDGRGALVLYRTKPGGISSTSGQDMLYATATLCFM